MRIRKPRNRAARWARIALNETATPRGALGAQRAKRRRERIQQRQPQNRAARRARSALNDRGSRFNSGIANRKTARRAGRASRWVARSTTTRAQQTKRVAREARNARAQLTKRAAREARSARTSVTRQNQAGAPRRRRYAAPFTGLCYILYCRIEMQSTPLELTYLRKSI